MTQKPGLRLIRRVGQMIAAFGTVALSSLILRAEEPSAKLSKTPNLTIDVQIVSLPTRVGIPLARSMMKEEEMEGAYQRLQELLAAGTAQLIGWPLITTTPRENQSVIHATNEIPWPTEWNAPGTPISFRQDPDSHSPRLAPPPHKDNGTIAAVPERFEMAEAGSILEVTPQISVEQAAVDLTVLVRSIGCLGNVTTIIDRGPQRDAVSAEQPLLEQTTVNQTFTLRVGEHALLGIAKTSTPPNSIRLAVLSVTSPEALPKK